MAGSDMMMILVVGAVLIGGFFLISQGGGLGNLLGGGAAPTAPAPTEGEGQDQEGMEGEDPNSPFEEYGYSTGPKGTTYKYSTMNPFAPSPFGGPGVPIGGPIPPPPGFGGPGPRPLPPIGGPGPRPMPPGPVPIPCRSVCATQGPFACKSCIRRFSFPGPPMKSHYAGGCGCGA